MHLRAGSRFELHAHLDLVPLRLLAIGALVSAILLSVPPIIRAARIPRSRLGSEGDGRPADSVGPSIRSTGG